MIEITNEDNMALMSRYEDNHFDLAIVDPPYGINAGKMTMGSGKHQFTKGKNWDNAPPTPEYFIELFRVSKEQIIWGGNYFDLPLNNNWIIWDKLNPNLSFSEAELAWCSIDKNVRIFKRLSTMADNDCKKQHPTQKPIELYRWILDKYGVKGQTILDTHLGSGSIAVACDDMGFNLVSCDIDPEYIKLAQKRLKLAQMQTKLF